MGSKDMGTGTAHCLPLLKPETCKDNAWIQLNDLFEKGLAPGLCEEKGSFYFNSLETVFISSLKHMS